MPSFARTALFAAVLCLAAPAALAAGTPPPPGPSAAEAKEKCEHGVKRTLCPRCNPKLAAVFKAKGDWCADHERPESQCVLCHPELAKRGIK